MLHQFIYAERESLVASCDSRMTSERRSRAPAGDEGVGPFLDQLVEALAPPPGPPAREPEAAADGRSASRSLGLLAARHAVVLMRRGYDIGEVVHAYGNVCQAITGLTLERDEPFTTAEFQTLNRCLDEAIACAVAEFMAQRDRGLALDASERMLLVAEQMQRHLGSAKTALAVLKEGRVGPGGATGAMLERNLDALQRIVDGPLIGMYLEAGARVERERISLCELFGGLQLAASMRASNRGCALMISPIDQDIAVDADRQILTSALAALLDKALSFARPLGRVLVAVSPDADRVLIEISSGEGEPAADRVSRRPGDRRVSAPRRVHQGLSSIESAIGVAGGELRIRDAGGGSGRTLTVDLPRL